MKWNKFYILDGHTPVPVETVEEWAKWMEEGIRRVALDDLGSVEVSTVFLGIDYQYIMGGPPQLFETMVFRGREDQECLRYATWDEAVAGHEETVERWRRREWPEVIMELHDEVKEVYPLLMEKWREME